MSSLYKLPKVVDYSVVCILLLGLFLLLNYLHVSAIPVNRSNPQYKVKNKYVAPTYYNYGHPEWSENTCQAITNHEIEVGMTEEQVRLSIGEPTDINTTVTEFDTTSQWVYNKGYSYVYFRNTKEDPWLHVSAYDY